MRLTVASLIATIAILVYTAHAQDIIKLQFTDCGSKSVDIKDVDLTPMPIYNPGPAFFTLVADLKRPVNTIQVGLDIIRTVSGIKLPVKCYIVNGQSVGSCTYADLCVFLQGILTEFQPDNCPPDLAQYEIDCVCPFKIKPQLLKILNHALDIPDVSKTPASFMASGNFDLTVTVIENDPAAPKPYACVRVLFTVKQKK